MSNNGFLDLVPIEPGESLAVAFGAAGMVALLRVPTAARVRMGVVVHTRASVAFAVEEV
jgi:hypothetical protein